MNLKRDVPEEANPSPEFIKVSYDKYGNPIDVRPAKGPAVAHNGHENHQPVQKVNIQTLGYDTKVIGNWLNVLNQNMYTIKEQIKSMENPSDKMIPFVEQISKNVSIFEQQFSQIKNEFNTIDKEFEIIKTSLKEAKVNDVSFLEQINLLRENLKIIQGEMNDSRHFSNLLMSDLGILKNKISETSVQIQSNTMQIQNTNTAMNDIVAEMNKIKDEIKNIRFDPGEIMESIDAINGNFGILRNSFVEMNQQVAGMINQMNAKVSDLSWKMENFATKEDISMVTSSSVSQQELNQAKDELEEQIRANHINREELVSEIVAQTSENMKKLLAKKRGKHRTKKIRIKVKRKIKKRKHSIRKKKIVRKVKKINKNILSKKLLKTDIVNYPSAVIVTERRTRRVGRAVFDVAKTLNKNVIMIMQEKMKESDGFEEATYGAMSNSDCIFIVTSKNMRKNFSLKTLVATKKVFIVSNKIKFAEMS